jgi:flavin reductase (DIM6/NTAB) family NADH-FMN oxidoreductase RutF
MADPDYAAVFRAADQTMLVVTAMGPQGPAGCLVSFATECSVKPPLYLVLLSRANYTFRVAEHTDTLAIHVLGEDDHAIAAHFGELTGDEVDKFAGVAWSPGPGGIPLLDGGLAWLTGTISGRYDPGGDHAGFILTPTAACVRRRGTPLRFSTARHLHPGHPA